MYSSNRITESSHGGSSMSMERQRLANKSQEKLGNGSGLKFGQMLLRLGRLVKTTNKQFIESEFFDSSLIRKKQQQQPAIGQISDLIRSTIITKDSSPHQQQPVAPSGHASTLQPSLYTYNKLNEHFLRYSQLHLDLSSKTTAAAAAATPSTAIAPNYFFNFSNSFLFPNKLTTAQQSNQ
jgi:hypothetical protein